MIKKLSPLSSMQFADLNLKPESHAKLLEVAAESLSKKVNIASKKFDGEIDINASNESAKRQPNIIRRVGPTRKES